MSEQPNDHEWVDRTVKTIDFHGDYSKLKSMGFYFQKLFASNYMQWRNEKAKVRVWKKNHDLEIDNFDMYGGTLLEMIIANTKFTINDKYGFRRIVLFVNELTGEISLDRTEFSKQEIKAINDYNADPDSEYVYPVWHCVTQPVETFELLHELLKLGWISVKEVKTQVMVPTAKAMGLIDEVA